VDTCKAISAFQQIGAVLRQNSLFFRVAIAAQPRSSGLFGLILMFFGQSVNIKPVGSHDDLAHFHNRSQVLGGIITALAPEDFVCFWAVYAEKRLHRWSEASTGGSRTQELLVSSRRVISILRTSFVLYPPECIVVTLILPHE
jgi:hypothetical protein